jgi:hypothetical protein
MGVDGRREFRAELHRLQRLRYSGKQPSLDDAVQGVEAARAERALHRGSTPAGAAASPPLRTATVRIAPERHETEGELCESTV